VLHPSHVTRNPGVFSYVARETVMKAIGFEVVAFCALSCPYGKNSSTVMIQGENLFPLGEWYQMAVVPALLA
jgi:hypothetical protein